VCGDGVASGGERSGSRVAQELGGGRGTATAAGFLVARAVPPRPHRSGEPPVPPHAAQPPRRPRIAPPYWPRARFRRPAAAPDLRHADRRAPASAMPTAVRRPPLCDCRMSAAAVPALCVISPACRRARPPPCRPPRASPRRVGPVPDFTGLPPRPASPCRPPQAGLRRATATRRPPPRRPRRVAPPCRPLAGPPVECRRPPPPGRPRQRHGSVTALSVPRRIRAAGSVGRRGPGGSPGSTRPGFGPPPCRGGWPSVPCRG
jgi:hypothetical protein